MNILDLLRQDGFSPTRRASTGGGEFSSPCPWCGGEDRFRLWPEENRYHCIRGCDRHGDAIQYLRDYRDLSYWDACEVVGREPEFKTCPKQVHRQEWQPKEIEPPSQTWQEYMTEFILWAVNQLAYDPGSHVATYLREERYLRDETVHCFLIGWNPKDMYMPKEKLGLADYEHENVWLPPGIVIPYFDSSGIKRVRIRTFSGNPRYYFVPGGSSPPMVINGDAGAVIVIESELDAILLSQEAGDLCSVIALGNDRIRPDVRTYEILQHSDMILISLDSDEAGAKQYWQWWRIQYPHAKRWPVPRGKDPTEAMGNGLNLRVWVLAGTSETRI